MSKEDSDRLADKEESLVEFIRRSPLYGDETLDFEREESVTREAGNEHQTGSVKSEAAES